jgi:hypothetical protein
MAMDEFFRVQADFPFTYLVKLNGHKLTQQGKWNFITVEVSI